MTVWSTGRSPPPPVLRTTMMLTVPGAGPGQWKTSTPSTEPPHALGLDGGGEAGYLHLSLPHQPRHLLLPPPACPSCSLPLLGAVSAVGNVPAGPGASPKVGAVLGVWEAESVSAISELAGSFLSLWFRSSARASHPWGCPSWEGSPKLCQAPSSSHRTSHIPSGVKAQRSKHPFWHHYPADQLLRGSSVLGWPWKWQSPRQRLFLSCEGLSGLAFRLPLGHAFPILCQEEVFSKAE